MLGGSPVPERPNPLQKAAGPRRVRPRGEAAAACKRPLGGPDLLQRRPVVGRALRPQQPAGVELLELNVHLEAAEEAVPGMCAPRPLVAMDTEPGAQVRRGGVAGPAPRRAP